MRKTHAETGCVNSALLTSIFFFQWSLTQNGDGQFERENPDMPCPLAKIKKMKMYTILLIRKMFFHYLKRSSFLVPLIKLVS
jgi:hypothetical protein